MQCLSAIEEVSLNFKGPSLTVVYEKLCFQKDIFVVWRLILFLESVHVYLLPLGRNSSSSCKKSCCLYQVRNSLGKNSFPNNKIQGMFQTKAKNQGEILLLVSKHYRKGNNMGLSHFFHLSPSNSWFKQPRRKNLLKTL